jgi:hypothetical protein
MSKIYFCTSCFLLFLLSCQTAQQESSETTNIPYETLFSVEDTKSEFLYDLATPDKKIKLPKELTEISGISLWKEDVFACVQDEEGRIYFFNEKEEKITEEYRFAKDGDFEDVVVANEIIYALRSDGKIYELHPNISEKWEEFEYQTELSSKNDTEGICLGPDGRKLLIACKNASGIDGHVKDHRGIYSFDLEAKKLDENPVSLISIDQIADVAGKKVSFMPSALAVHPKTQDIYIISSVGKILLVLDSQNHIKHLQSLKHDHFKQPEGICFLPDGTLYISNEGKSGKANLLRFEMGK